jgi:hypothetical protein
MIEDEDKLIRRETRSTSPTKSSSRLLVSAGRHAGTANLKRLLKRSGSQYNHRRRAWRLSKCAGSGLFRTSRQVSEVNSGGVAAADGRPIVCSGVITARVDLCFVFFPELLISSCCKLGQRGAERAAKCSAGISARQLLQNGCSMCSRGQWEGESDRCRSAVRNGAERCRK